MSLVDGLEKRLVEPGTSVIPYLTGGYPDMAAFTAVLAGLAGVAPVIELGIPFSDPMADGATIQESSRVALEKGASLGRILDAVAEVGPLPVELVVMSYLNPLLANGVEAAVGRLREAAVSAVVIPDLPHDEAGEMAAALTGAGIGLIQMVTPLTSDDRLARLGSASRGFTYAVTMTGTTGGRLAGEEEVARYLDRVREVSRPPVVAGFGVRSRDQVAALSGHCDGVIVGSALVEVIASGGDPVAFLQRLQP